MSLDWVPLKSLNLVVGSEGKFCTELLPHSICLHPGELLSAESRDPCCPSECAPCMTGTEWSKRASWMLSESRSSSSGRSVGDGGLLLLLLIPYFLLPDGASSSPRGPVWKAGELKGEAAQAGFGRKGNCNEVGDSGSRASCHFTQIVRVET